MTAYEIEIMLHPIVAPYLNSEFEREQLKYIANYIASDFKRMEDYYRDRISSLEYEIEDAKGNIKKALV